MVLEFFWQYKAIISFYFLIVLFLLWQRKRIVSQAKVILLYPTSFGIKFINRFSEKFGEWIKLYGYIGLGVCYVGLIAMLIILIFNIYKILTQPAVPSGLALVLPGVKIPGIGVLPFWYWLIAIFLIALVHEFSHGIVAKAHKIKIKSTGLVFLGPIIGAFVEPEEKRLYKERDIVQYSVLAAGSFANIILAFLALIILSLLLSPAYFFLTQAAGVSYQGYVGEDYPAAKILPKEGVITYLNGEKISSLNSFMEKTFCLKPNEKINLTVNNQVYSLVLAESPYEKGKGFIGISEMQGKRVLKEEFKKLNWLHFVVLWLVGLFKWLYVLSLGIGLFNILPLPLVDGGKIIQISSHQIKGKKKGEKYFKIIILFSLLVLLLNLFLPYLVKSLA